MDDLKSLIDGTLEDESNAGDEYGVMIEATKESSLTEESKGLIVAMLEKIQADEHTHHQMLLVIQEVVNEEAK
jgi:hypothetical protein